MEILSTYEILAACCIKEKNKTSSNTVVIISTGKYSETELTKLETKTTFMNVNFEFLKYEDILIADFIFRNSKDPNLYRTVQLLKSYTKEIETLTEDDSLPIIQFALIPMETKGKNHIIFERPISWSLCTDNIEGCAKKIRMIFSTENVLGFENQDMNYNAIIAEVKARERQEAFLEEEEEKKRKRDAFEADFLSNQRGAKTYE